MVSSAVRKYAALCMVFLCSSLFFLGLYQFNNKYSQNTIQAANGILALSEEELQKSPGEEGDLYETLRRRTEISLERQRKCRAGRSFRNSATN